MVELDEPTSNPQGSQARLRVGRSGRPIGGVREADRREIEEMVELDETISNQLFQTLADWNDQLKDAEEIIHTDKIGGPQP